MYCFSGDNPTRLYYDALKALVEEGDVVSPRGKIVKELRPACVEFTKPTNRVTFLGSRRINPFFQLAEALWILSGRADVEWLLQFNNNMKQFSDDGVWFNASYGERIRTWNKNAAHGVIINPVDQLEDAFIKLSVDRDTRQAVVVISNPMFDNAKYTIGEKGKDIACNLIFTFKIRHDKLDITVFNRSNDAHWGLWGANLAQFSTIQEVMAAWLGVEVGQYTQVTDSLHIYLDDYGSKCTTDVIDYYKSHKESEVDADFTCKNEPRMSLNKEKFDNFLTIYWGAIDEYVSDDEYLGSTKNVEELLEFLDSLHENGEIDDYWDFAIRGMIAYRLNRLGNIVSCLELVGSLRDCQWKISMMYFMKTFIYKVGKDVERIEEYNTLVRLWNTIVDDLVLSLEDSSQEDSLRKYLEL